MQPLSENLADTYQAQGAEPATSYDTTLAKSVPGTSRAPVPPVNPTISNIGPDCFLKLQAQMAILLHHICFRMPKFIAQAEDQIEKKVAYQK